MVAAFHGNQQVITWKDSVSSIELQFFQTLVGVIGIINHPEMLVIKNLPRSFIQQREIRTDRDYPLFSLQVQREFIQIWNIAPEIFVRNDFFGF